MLIVVAPSSSAIWSTSAVNSTSARVASFGENSTWSTRSRAWATAARAWPFTSSRVERSWCSMWMSDVEMKVWIRGRAASRTASAADSTSAAWARASPAMIGPSTSRAMAWTASKSPGEAIGKPASMTSTRSRASWWAISSFSDGFSEMPGDCSPSRSVVSKITTRLLGSCVMSSPLRARLLRSPLGSRLQRPPRAIPPEGGGGEVEGRAGAATSVDPRYTPSRDEDHIPDVPPLGERPVGVAGPVERHLLGHDRPRGAAVEEVGERTHPGLERPVLVPQREHVQADDRLGLLHLRDEVEAGHRHGGLHRRHEVPLVAGDDVGGAEGDEPAAGPEQAVGAAERAPAEGVHHEVHLRQVTVPAPLRVVERVVDAVLADGAVLSGRGGAEDL